MYPGTIIIGLGAVATTVIIILYVRNYRYHYYGCESKKHAKENGE